MQTRCHCHSLSPASVKSRLVLPFWYRLTRVVPEKGPLNGCVCVCLMHISIAQLCTLHYCCPSVGPSVSDFDKSTKPYTCSFDYQIRGRKLNLAYINPMTSRRWPSSFLLKPDNEFSAIMSSLNIFHSLMTILLKKNFAISNLTHMLILHQNN